MWMDHRAVEEAKLITATQHAVVEQFGGTCSPEFSLSKLLWIKRRKPLRFENAIGFMELPDWLSWRCSTFSLVQFALLFVNGVSMLKNINGEMIYLN